MLPRPIITKERDVLMFTRLTQLRATPNSEYLHCFIFRPSGAESLELMVPTVLLSLASERIYPPELSVTP